jgi:hypothetical protein
VIGKARRTVSCSLKATARLTRGGRTVARGTRGTLRAGKRLAPGHYTLRAGSRKLAVILT